MRFVKYLFVFVVHGVVFTCLGVLTLILLQQKGSARIEALAPCGVGGGIPGR